MRVIPRGWQEFFKGRLCFICDTKIHGKFTWRLHGLHEILWVCGWYYDVHHHGLDFDALHSKSVVDPVPGYDFQTKVLHLLRIHHAKLVDGILAWGGYFEGRFSRKGFPALKSSSRFLMGADVASSP